MKCADCRLWTPPPEGKRYGVCGLEFPSYVYVFDDDNETTADEGCSFGQPKETAT